MKRSIVKWLLIIPLLLFLDWILMVMFGCFSSLCGADNKYFCSVYCYTGISLLFLTVIGIFVIFYKSRVRK